MTTNYRASSTVSQSLASLPHSGTLVAGRCTASYSNATNKDDWLKPYLQTRTAGTLATGGVIELWGFEQRADGTWPDLFTVAYTGSAGDFTILSRDNLQAGAILLASVTTPDSTARNYTLRGRELAQAFGAVPQVGAFFIVHSLGASGGILSATAGDHVLSLNAGSWA